MKQIFCRDVRCCSHKITAENDRELRNNFFEHLRKLHPDILKTMAPETKREFIQTLHKFTKTI
jgi:predicted small metal-binding protein